MKNCNRSMPYKGMLLLMKVEKKKLSQLESLT